MTGESREYKFLIAELLEMNNLQRYTAKLVYSCVSQRQVKPYPVEVQTWSPQIPGFPCGVCKVPVPGFRIKLPTAAARRYRQVPHGRARRGRGCKVGAVSNPSQSLDLSRSVAKVG
eukprot:gene166-16_t